jgi:hypothetical protein
MGDFEVEIDGMRRAAAASIAAGGEAKKIDLAAVREMAPAMSGSTSSNTVARLADVWQRRLEQWATDIQQFGKTTSAAADLYSSNDQVAEENFDALWWN